MDYLEPKPLNEKPGHLESGSDFPVKENISGGYNAYDNVLRLIKIQDFNITIPSITLIDGIGFSSSLDSTIFHELVITPFIEVEWQDPSFNGSGGNVIYQYFIDCRFNDLRINVAGSINVTNFIDPTDVIPEQTLPIRVLIYELRTKRRLDTYVK